MKKSLMLRMSAWMLAIVLCLSMTLTAFAAATDGSYTASAQGNNGPIEVTVTVSQGQIAQVTVGSHSETPGISDPAFERIPAAIAEKQTLAVDTVSGATNTSVAILQATEACLAQAGFDIEALKVAPEKEQVQSETVVMTADLAVVGGGGAGMIGAIQAVQLGGTAIIIEKTAAVGGNTAASGGNYAAVDPERQSAQGIEDSVEKHIEQVFSEGDSVAKKELVATMCENALDGLHWLEDLGVQWNDTVFQVIGSLWPRTHSNIESSGAYLVKVLKENVDKLGIPVLLETKATQLIVEDGRVVGVIAQGADGTNYEVYGEKGVLLATGGFGANLEMCMELSSKITPNTQSLSVGSAQGEGLVMAQAAGAKLIDLEKIQMLPTSLTTLPANNNSVLYLNQEGQRFVQEDGRRDKMSMAVLDQTGGYCYIFNDQAVVDLDGTQEKADALIASGDVIKADTLEQLAEMAGMPYENLAATIEEYNKLVAGEVQDPFGRTLAELPVGEGPYYLSCKQYPMVLYTCGGVDIDTSARALDENGQPVPGLFAAGEVTGGVHGNNRLGSHALADLTVFARIAATTAMSE